MSENKVTLRNLDRAAEQHVRAADGNAIQLQPGQTATVDAKYAWNPPPKVEIVKDRAVSVSSPVQASTATTLEAAPTAVSRRSQAVPAAE